jgi:ribosomal protein S18 acetylase RimI-like enzyme
MRLTVLLSMSSGGPSTRSPRPPTSARAVAKLAGGRHHGAVIAVRILGVDDWRDWRALRLAALVEAPDAFSSRLADWQGDGDREERWQDRLTGRWHNVVAELDGRPAGMASGLLPDDGPAELLSTWVAPFARGRGVGDALVSSVVAWAQQEGRGEVRLQVREANPAAIALYARHGFVDRGPVDDEPGEPPERWMVLAPE